LNLINIVNDQQKEIKKLKMKNSNQNKSLNDIMTIKKRIKNINDNLKQNKKINIKSNIKSLKFSNSNLQERYLRAFSTTKKNRGPERTLLNNYLSNYNILKNDKKTFPKKRKLLQIKKLISLIAKKRSLFVLIETAETNNNFFKIYKEDSNSLNSNPAPIFYTSTLVDPNGIKDGEIYKIFNEQFLESIIKTEKYSQLIFCDRGYLLEKEKPSYPKINLIVDRNEKNDIYIYTLKLDNKNNNINNNKNIVFSCEDLNCKGEGILDLEKNNFSIVHQHEIKHKDYHINEDSHFTVQFFWNLLFKYREIKTIEVILLPNEYDLKAICNNPTLICQNINKNYNTKSKGEILFSTSTEKDRILEKKTLAEKEAENKKEKSLNSSIEQKDNSSKSNIGKTTFHLKNNKSHLPIFSSINYNIIKENEKIPKNDINKNINNNSSNNGNGTLNLGGNCFNSINNSTNINDIDNYKFVPSEFEKSSNNDKDKNENDNENKNSINDGNDDQCKFINNSIDLQNYCCKFKEESNNSGNTINEKKTSEKEEKEEKEEEEIYEGDTFSLSGSEEVFKDCYVKSKKRRKVCNSSFMIYKNKIYEQEELSDFSFEDDTFSFCSQCTICAQIKQTNTESNKLQNNTINNINCNNLYNSVNTNDLNYNNSNYFNYINSV